MANRGQFSTPLNDPLITRADAARLLGVKLATLGNWASTRRYDLPYVRIGRSVRYRLSDVTAFIERNRVVNQAGAA
jgi:excisionase family DNA binding protein